MILLSQTLREEKSAKSWKSDESQFKQNRSKLLQPESFSVFLKTFKTKLHCAFYVLDDVNKFSLQRGIPTNVMQEIMSCNPLAVGIPEKLGGRGGLVHETLALLAATSYESLSLSLTFGINLALFLQPVTKYGHTEIQESIFKRFLEDKNMGGFMMTEPDHGTDALSMQTSFVEHDKYYHLRGTKHWNGLTNWADFWLIAARQQSKSGKLKRDINFFVCDTSKPNQTITAQEMYDSLGLYLIPYGRNKIDIKIPKVQKLNPQSTGINMMLDILYCSRLLFPGMAMGFLERILKEGKEHCKERSSGGKSLINYDQVKERLTYLQAAFTICSAMCTYVSKHMNIRNNLFSKGLEANVVKSVVTDLMQEASQSLLQLMGAKGYKLSQIAGRATIDSRPFQIFEGSNDVLYIQIAETILKLMKDSKEENLFKFLATYPLAKQTAKALKQVLDFRINLQLSQRKLTELGRIVGRIICMEMVFEFKDLGFREDLVNGALNVLEQEIINLLSTYNFVKRTNFIEDYEENSSWLDLVG